MSRLAYPYSIQALHPPPERKQQGTAHPTVQRQVLLIGLLLSGTGLGIGCHKPTSIGSPQQANTPSLPHEQQTPWFQDVTNDVGLSFVHDAGSVNRYFLPQATGSGAAV